MISTWQSWSARLGPPPNLNSVNIFEFPVWSHTAKYNDHQYSGCTVHMYVASCTRATALSPVTSVRAHDQACVPVPCWLAHWHSSPPGQGMIRNMFDKLTSLYVLIMQLYYTHTLTWDSLKFLQLSNWTYRLTCLTKSQKALEAYGCKSWVTNLVIVLCAIGILTANSTYCIILLEYIYKSQVNACTCTCSV